MNKLLLELDYQTYLVCASNKDEQELFRILSNALIVKENWQKKCTFYTDKVPKIKFIPGSEILECEPVEEENENESRN